MKSTYDRINDVDLRYKYFEFNGKLYYNRLIIETTNICNHNCVQCAYGKFNDYPKEIMTNEKFYKMIDDAANFGYTYVCICPYLGENLTDPDWWDKIQYLENHPGIDQYNFFTNFTLWDHADIDKLKTLNKLQYMAISVYGYDEYEFINMTKTNTQTFDKFQYNINYLNKLKLDVNLHIRFFTSKQNISEMIRGENFKSILNLVNNYKVDYYKDIPGSSWHGVVGMENLETVGFDIKELPTEFPTICGHMISKHVIYVNGDIGFCGAYDTFRTTKLGNIFEESFDDIYSKNHKLYDDVLDTCKECNIYSEIGDDNLHNSWIETVSKIYNHNKLK